MFLFCTRPLNQGLDCKVRKKNIKKSHKLFGCMDCNAYYAKKIKNIRRHHVYNLHSLLRYMNSIAYYVKRIKMKHRQV